MPYKVFSVNAFRFLELVWGIIMSVSLFALTRPQSSGYTVDAHLLTVLTLSSRLITRAPAAVLWLSRQDQKLRLAFGSGRERSVALKRSPLQTRSAAMRLLLLLGRCCFKDTWVFAVPSCSRDCMLHCVKTVKTDYKYFRAFVVRSGAVA